MDDKELQQKRLAAAGIDVAIAVGIGLVFTVVAIILGFGSGFVGYLSRIFSFLAAAGSVAYVLGRDFLAEGRSFGKKFQDIRVVKASGRPIDLMDSVKRNGIFAIGGAFQLLSAGFRLIPCLGDMAQCLLWPLTIIGSLAVVAAVVVEIVKITQDPQGIRMGDQMAETRVVR